VRFLAFALLLASASPALADTTWRPVDADTGQIRDVEGLEQLARDFPNSGSVRLRLLQPLLEAGETDRLIETLRWLNERGYVFGEVSQKQIPQLVGEEYADEARTLLIEEPTVIEASEVIATVPVEAQLVESVLVDPAYGRLIVSTVHSRAVMVIGNMGQLVPMTLTGADNLSGLAASPDRDHIWVASGNIDGSERDPDRFAGLMSVRPGTGDRSRIVAPDGVNPSDLAVGADGTFYASDPIGGGVYMAGTGDERLRPLVAPGTFRSPQGLAVSDDGSKLYVSDYRYGIAIVDLSTGEVHRLASDVPAILDGVDGLWLHEGDLVAMQNGTSPMRISAFKLSEDGKRVVSARVLEQAHSGWTEPLGGSVSGDALIYVATGHWDRYVQGEPISAKPPTTTDIRKLDLSISPD
jgi:hypothetical protein